MINPDKYFYVHVLDFNFYYNKVLVTALSILNYKMFDFFNTKFDYSSYLKNYAKYYFFYRGLVY